MKILTPQIAIVTNSIRRSSDLVIKSLQSSLSQAGDDIEIIFIDQNSPPMLIPENISNHPRFRRINAAVSAVSQARNRAVFSPSVEWVVFCDDDGYLSSDYIHLLRKQIEVNPEVEIFAGAIRRIDNLDFYSKRHQVGGDPNHFWNTKLLMGSNFVIRKATFEKLGCFDEKFGAGAQWGSGEETDLAWNAYFSKAKIKFEPSLVVFHIPPHAGVWKLESKKAYQYGVGKGALVSKWLIEKRHPIVLLEAIEMFILPIVMSVLSLLTFNFRNIAIQTSAFSGRWVGMVKYLNRDKKA